MDSELTSIVNFWFQDLTKKFWFDSTPEFDTEITTKFSSVLEKYDISKLTSNQIKYISDRYILSLSLIILHDQIPRHIYRNNDDGQINKHLGDILNFCKKIYAKNKYDLTDEHFCFILLPLRHTNNFENIMFVIEETKLRLDKHKSNNIYKKFLKATLERYIKFNDDKSNIILSNENKSIKIITDDKQICEKEFIEYHPMDFARLTEKIQNNTIPKYIIEFIDTIKKNISVKNGTVSLSGGVDSMVLSYFLKYLDININAIHINYNNREECSDECNIIQQWSDFINIKLYIRKIIEINRKDMMEWNQRDLYETYTRDVRYNSYINMYDNEENNIFMGHNKDDQFENIFTNIVSESHYDNLRGMTVNTTQSFKNKNINFIRPMLDIPKETIYKIASYIGIPYFKDSTPKWSQRGKIRDNVRPSIEQWDERAIESFFKLSDSVADLIKIVDMFATTIVEQIKINKNLELNLVQLYPKYLFKIIFQKLNIKMSQKGLNSFYAKLEFIKTNKKKYKMNSVEKYRLNIDTVIKWKNLSDNNILINM
jgi:tRNA(Ile)-lysidine synthetase-like protein